MKLARLGVDLSGQVADTDGMAINHPNRYTLSDRDRAHIRSTANKIGYVVRAVHCTGPRGGRFRDEIIFAGVTETDAHRQADRVVERPWLHPIIDVDVVAVDALGYVQS